MTRRACRRSEHRPADTPSSGRNLPRRNRPGTAARNHLGNERVSGDMKNCTGDRFYLSADKMKIPWRRKALGPAPYRPSSQFQPEWRRGSVENTLEWPMGVVLIASRSRGQGEAMTRTHVAKRLDEMEIAVHQGRASDARRIAAALLNELGAARLERARDGGGRIRQSDVDAATRAVAILRVGASR
jgi:hypothetical protein